MDTKILNKLEFNIIINRLSLLCETSIGKEISNSLLPSFNFSEVKNLLDETNEAFSFLHYLENEPHFFAFPINLCIKKMQSKQYLTLSELLNIANLLKNSRTLKDTFYNNESINSIEFPVLNNTFSALYTNINIEKNIFSKILDDTKIDDHASDFLYSIRCQERNIENSIKETLNHFIYSSNSKYLQEPVITIRNNRYVIPVKEEFRGNVKGFIHDISSTGSTLFIEPLSIFEMNNELSHLKIKEEQEIEKILIELSSLLIPVTCELLQTCNAIGKLDFIFAKAKLANSMNAHKPFLTEEKSFSFVEAKHPLISSDKVVPITLPLGNNYNTLVITGPNTGGKTVSLKTCGLLLLMAYSGLFITANEASTICVFDNIFVDVGDEQSIENSLSTFSSHMTNIIYIIQHASKNSLILIDELGSGTDPIEGSSLALSILEYFNNLGSLTIATTHYPEIKNYCLTTSGFENACVEFDIQTLQPTYKLLIGIPGKSNAFAISKKLGLSDSILNRAKSFLESDTFSIEELLKSIYDDKSLIEKEKDTIQKQLKQIELLKSSLENEKNKIKDKKEKIIEDAKQEAREILLDAKEKVSYSIREMQNGSQKNLNQIRNSLNNSIKSTYSNSISTHNVNTKNTSFHPIQKGDTVFVSTLNQNGIVLSEPNKSKQVQVQVGPAKLNVELNKLSYISSPNNSNTKSSSSKISLEKNKKYTNEINVIGNNVEEAIFVIDKFLDDCSLVNLKEVRIVHGKGTGILRNGIHNFLRKNPHVESFRLGTFGEGEMGVTVVTLKGKH